MLEKNADRTYSLNLQKYRTELTELRATAKQLDSRTKLKNELKVSNATQDIAILETDKDKAERNKQWLKRVSSDIYIGETIKVMDNMIRQEALAKAK